LLKLFSVYKNFLCHIDNLIKFEIYKLRYIISEGDGNEKSEKVIILAIVLAIIFSIGTVIVIRTVQEFTEGSDLGPFVVVVFARLETLLGFLAIIVVLFLREVLKTLKKPKIDLLELEEKI
jgi:hypothetical protein